MEVLINWSDPTFYGQFWLLIVRTGVTALKEPKRTGTENGEPQLLEGQMSCRMRMEKLFPLLAGWVRGWFERGVIGNRTSRGLRKTSFVQCVARTWRELSEKIKKKQIQQVFKRNLMKNIDLGKSKKMGVNKIFCWKCWEGLFDQKYQSRILIHGC